MTDLTDQEESVELLQQLGLKEYEARCFVALCRLPSGTAKQISEISEVPRTRIYDAIRVLEAKGLVEVQHASPKRFRAVSVEEAARTLRDDFAERTDELLERLRGIDAARIEDESDVSHEVWSLSGATAIENRALELLDDSEEEILLVVGHEDVLTPELFEILWEKQEGGIDVIVGTMTERLRERVHEELPGTETFVSGLEWLNGATVEAGDETVISRLVLVDRRAILVSTRHESFDGVASSEQAIFGSGFTNGLVVVARRLMATGLEAAADPGTGE